MLHQKFRLISEFYKLFNAHISYILIYNDCYFNLKSLSSVDLLSQTILRKIGEIFLLLCDIY